MNFRMNVFALATGVVVGLQAAPARAQVGLPLGCNAADVSDVLYQLDFNDVVAYLNSFSLGDASADYTDPVGLDFNDVIAFLEYFAAGCPEFDCPFYGTGPDFIQFGPLFSTIADGQGVSEYEFDGMFLMTVSETGQMFWEGLQMSGTHVSGPDRGPVNIDAMSVGLQQINTVANILPISSMFLQYRDDEINELGEATMVSPAQIECDPVNGAQFYIDAAMDVGGRSVSFISICNSATNYPDLIPLPAGTQGSWCEYTVTKVFGGGCTLTLGDEICIRCPPGGPGTCASPILVEIPNTNCHVQLQADRTNCGACTGGRPRFRLAP